MNRTITNKSNPEVSVIMPAFNAGIFISEAIESIQQQSLQEWELIVVDDGSTDETASIVEGVVRNDARVRLLRLPHVGIEGALNAGLDAARADVVARMDADDICQPDRLEKQVKYLHEYPEVGVVACGVRLISREEGSQGLKTYVDWVNALQTHDQISFGQFIDAPLIHPSVCFQKELVTKHGGYRQGDFPEDYELWLRWLHAGVRMEKLPDVLLEWRDHSGKLTRTDERYREEALWEVKGKALEKWFSEHVDTDRDLLIWGSGRKTRSRLCHLESLLELRKLAAYIDIDPRKIGKLIHGVPVIGPESLMDYPRAFVLAMVGSRGARELIRVELMQQGKREGEDFLLLA